MVLIVFFMIGLIIQLRYSSVKRNMEMTMKIAVIQICSHLEPEKNIKKIDDFIKKAKDEAKIEAVFLPEVFYSMSDATTPTPYLVEQGNEHYKAIQKLAMDNNVYLIGGTAATNLDGRVINRAYNFDPNGNELEHYDKMHLFAVDLSKTKNKTVIDEATVYTPGSTPKMITMRDWKIGLGICFDIRFPEFFRNYYNQGANLLTAASAFTVPTGKAHWETLLRARAIENQSYVVAAGQWGEHNQVIKTYGHSMVIDPWGRVIANAGDGEKYVIADLDFELLQEVRARMKVKPRFNIEL